MLEDEFKPTPIVIYGYVTISSGSLGAFGAGLVSAASGMPIEGVLGMAVGTGFLFSATGLLVSLIANSNERTAWWNYRAANDCDEKPALQPEKRDYPIGQLIETSRGPAVMDHNTGVMYMLKNWNKKRKEVTHNYEQAMKVVGQVVVEHTGEVPEDEDQKISIDVNAGLWRFARYGAAKLEKISEGNWTGTDKPFSLDEFRLLRDYFITNHYAAWIHPRAGEDKRYRPQGWTFTHRTKRVMEALAGSATPPPPEVVAVQKP